MLVNPKESGVPCPAPWVKAWSITKTLRFATSESRDDLFPTLESGLKEYKNHQKECLHAVYRMAKPRSPLQEFTTSSEHYNMKAGKANGTEETCRKKQGVL